MPSEPVAVTLLVIEALERLDMAYLCLWAAALGVADLLERVLTEVG